MRAILVVLFIAVIVTVAVVSLRRAALPTRLRSVLAVLFGFFVMALTVTLLTLITVRVLDLRSGHPTPGYIALNMAYSVAAAVLGGWVTGDLAPFRRVYHGVALGALMIAFSVPGLAHPGTGQPFAYLLFLAVVPPFAAVLGSRLAPPRVL